jgi:hypothetical protein
LKVLNLPFDSILPEEILDYNGNLILTTRKESPIKCKKLILDEDVCDQHFTVIRGLMLQKLNLDYEENHLVIGIDPGHQIGLSVFYFGKEIESSFYLSIEELVLHIIDILGSLRAKQKIIKIGNGNMEIAKKIEKLLKIIKIGNGNMEIAKKIEKLLNLKFCSSFELEYVDESKTTVKIKNFNQRGKRDMLSAKFISKREGYRYSILPLSLTG